jgi:DNA excision repair protein ERCC-5
MGSIKILQNYIASQLSTTVEHLQKNHSLPSLQSSLLEIPKNKSMKIYEELVDLHRSQDISDSYDGSDSDNEPSIAHNYSDLQNIDSIDINSDSFKSLPPDIRYEILTELKLKYKGWRNTDIMPKESIDFSTYQMQRLLKKRDLQQNIEETMKILNSQSSDDVIQSWNEKSFFSESETNTGRLMSDENIQYILLKKSQTFKSENSLLIDTKQSEKTQINEIIDISNTSENHSMSSSDFEPSFLTNSYEQKIDNNFLMNTSEEKMISETENKIENEKLIDISFAQKQIVISDESDIEKVDDQKVSNNKTIDIKENESFERLKESSNNFTAIKTIEISSDSNDDFEEVSPQSPDSFDELIANIDVKDLQKIISKESTTPQASISKDSSLNRFETTNKGLETIEEMHEIESEKSDFVPQSSDLSLNSPEKSNSPLKSLNSPQKSLNSPMKSNPTSSQFIPIERISREEELETRREVNKQDRYANHTTDKMMTECQELLRLFGLPFIISPMEAEAQCAALEELGLTNGTITDDSDVLLFGAQTVYKNFFTSSKYVELYKASDIESRFGLSRSAMICIAMLCGSDYTDGVDGVGAVKATEILSEFPGDGLKPLENFKNWWINKQNSKDKKPENSIRAKLMKLRLQESFPNKIVFDAYINPTVDTSSEQFSWAMPRLDDLRQFASDKFGWNYTKADQILLPVMKKVNEKQVIIIKF